MNAGKWTGLFLAVENEFDGAWFFLSPIIGCGKESMGVCLFRYMPVGAGYKVIHTFILRVRGFLTPAE